MQSSPAISTLPEEKLVRTIKVKIYAGQGKAQLIRQALGNSRFCWNELLERNMELYRKERKFRIDERRLVLPKVGWVMEGVLNALINILGLRLIAPSVRHIEHMREMVSMRRRAF